MSDLRLFFLILTCILCQASVTGAKSRVVCYFTNWAQYRQESGKYLPSNVPPYLCTHIIFAFTKLSATDRVLEPFEWNDISTDGNGNYNKITHLKKCNPDLKVLLAVGGATLGNTPFIEMSSTEASRTKFIQHAIKFLKDNGFDGLDLDWEYPTAAEKEQFTQLVKETKTAFKETNLLLTAAVPINENVVKAGFDVKTIADNLDWISVMAYDMHGSWDDKLGHNAPLYASSKDAGFIATLNVEYSAKLWHKLGVPKDKLVIGVPTYGRTLTVQNPSADKPNNPAVKGEAFPGKFTKAAGSLAYYEICELLPTANKKVWDKEMQVPYAVFENKYWVGYDDDEAAKKKAEFIKKNGYGGAMVWTLDFDDFTGTFCKKGKYPIINALNKVLRGGKPEDYLANEGCTGKTVEKPSNPAEINNNKQLNEPKDINAPISKPKVPPSAEKGKVICKNGPGQSSFHKDSSNCKMYFMCEGTRNHHMRCPAGLGFNWKVNTCDWASNILGCQ